VLGDEDGDCDGAVDGAADGARVASGDRGVVDGDADGDGRSGPSLVRPVGDSVQAAARVTTRARSQKPLASLFIRHLP
jgi:hypothetical protein